MYGRIGAMAVRSYIYCTNLNWLYQCSIHRFNPFGFHLQHVQFLYGILKVCTHVLWDSLELWLNACTSNVQIWINVTNVQCTVAIHLVAIPILYSWCTDEEPIFPDCFIRELWSNTLCTWIEFTNIPPTVSIHLVVICKLYSWCTDLQPILKYICTVSLKLAVRTYINCTGCKWQPNELKRCREHLLTLIQICTVDVQVYRHSSQLSHNTYVQTYKNTCITTVQDANGSQMDWNGAENIVDINSDLYSRCTGVQP